MSECTDIEFSTGMTSTWPRPTIDRLRRSDYARSLSRLVSATAIAHLVTMAATPFITRLYSPNAYGVAATYTALAAVLGSVAALRYDFAIVIANTDELAISIAALCGILIATVCTVTAVAVAVVRLASPTAFGSLGEMLWVLPISAFAIGVGLVVTSLANRYQLYANIGRAKVANSMSTALITLGLSSPLHNAATGIVFGAAFGYLVGAGTNCLGLRRPVRGLLRANSLAAERLRGVAREYRDLPKYNLWTTLLDSVSTGLPIWFFSAAFSPVVAAQYALANTVLRVPSALLGQSVSQVFYERSARAAGNSAVLSRLLRRNIYFLSSIGAPFVLCILAGGPWLFKLIFGSQWVMAGSFARALVFLAATSLVSSPLSVLTIVLDRQREYFWIIALVAVARAVSIAVGAWLHSPGVAVALLAGSEGGVYVLFLVWLDRIVRVPRTSDLAGAGSAASLGETTT